MFSRSAILSLVVLFSFAIPLFAAPDAKKNVQQSVKQSISAEYASEDAAIANKDVDGSTAAYALDVVILNFDGKRVQGVKYVRKEREEMFQLPASFSANHKIQLFSTGKTGKDATVLVVHHIAMSATPEKGDPFLMGLDEVSRQFWVQGETGWHIKQKRIISTSSTRNGKPFQHNGKSIH